MNALPANISNSQLIGALTLTAHYVTAGQPFVEASQRTRLGIALQACQDNPHLASLSLSLDTVPSQDESRNTAVLHDAIIAVKGQLHDTDPDYQLLTLAHQQLQNLAAGKSIAPERRYSGIEALVPSRKQWVQELETLLAEMQDLSHDIRNPLGVILSCIEYIEPVIDPEIASDMRLSLNNLMGLITVLDRLANPEVKEARNYSIDMRLYIQPALIKRIFRKYKRSIRLSWDVPSTPLTIYANGIALSRIIDNLIVNSVEAMLEAERRELHIAATVIELEHDDTRQRITALIEQAGIHIGNALNYGSYIHLSIEDTGMGMDQETINHMFERHFSTKADSSRVRGLGMHRVRKEISEMDGALYVISQPEQGTQFHLFFPKY